MLTETGHLPSLGGKRGDEAKGGCKARGGRQSKQRDLTQKAAGGSSNSAWGVANNFLRKERKEHKEKKNRREF